MTTVPRPCGLCLGSGRRRDVIWYEPCRRCRGEGCTVGARVKAYRVDSAWWSGVPAESGPEPDREAPDWRSAAGEIEVAAREDHDFTSHRAIT